MRTEGQKNVKAREREKMENNELGEEKLTWTRKSLRELLRVGSEEIVLLRREVMVLTAL